MGDGELRNKIIICIKEVHCIFSETVEFNLDLYQVA